MAMVIHTAARRRACSFLSKPQRRIPQAAATKISPCFQYYNIQYEQRYAFSCGKRQRRRLLLSHPLRHHQQDRSLSSEGRAFEMPGAPTNTNTIASSNINEDMKLHENVTQSLLESSSNSWDSVTRNQALQSIRFWTSSKKNKQNDVDYGDIRFQSSLSFSFSLKLWNRLVEEERNNEDFIFVEKQQLFHKILFLWGEQDPSYQVQFSPLEMISLIQDYSSKGIIHPTDTAYNTILNALPQIMKQPPRHLRQRKQQQQQQQQQQQKSTKNSNHLVDESIPASTTNPEEFADTILRQMVVRNDIPNPSMATFTTVLNIWASGTHPERISRVQKLEHLRKELALENQIKNNNKTSNDDRDQDNNMGNMKSTLMYKSMLMNAYAKAGRPHDCEAIWEDWWGDYAEDKTIEPPNIQVATIILSGWSKANNPIRAESFLRELVEMHERGILREPPKEYSYTVVLDAWAKSRVRNGAERAEAILNEMEDHVSLQPTVVAYTSVIQAYAKRGDIKKAESLFKSMISAGLQPNTMTFNVFLHGIENIERAIILLRRMKALCKSQQWDCAPDVTTYSTLIRICAKKRDPLKAEQVWNEMINDHIKPDAMAYNHRLNAYTQCGQPVEAQALLDKMIRNYLHSITTNNNDDDKVETSSLIASVPPKPEIISFNTVLSAWADITNIQQAEALFQNLRDLHPRIRDLKPNVVTYTILLNCWSKSNVGEEIMIKRVKSLFLEMETNDKLQPNLISYSTLCKCFARCGMGQSAMATIVRMRRKGIEPNNAVYAQVLHALAEQCVRNPDDLSILGSIEEQLREMVEAGVAPTPPMFSAWLKAIGASSIPEKGRRAKEVVNAMKSVGLEPNDVILRQLKRIQDMS